MTKLKSGDEGSALLAALLASSLLASLGLALAGSASMEVILASNHRAGTQASYAADAAAEAVLADVLMTSNWTDILGGVVVSQLSGSTQLPGLPGAPSLTLGQLTTMVQAQSSAAGSWGADTPQWRVFAHGWISELAAAAPIADDQFLVAWVADDVGETDGNPFVDTNSRVQFIARAINTQGMQRTVGMTTAQTIELTNNGIPGVRVLAWREVR